MLHTPSPPAGKELLVLWMIVQLCSIEIPNVEESRRWREQKPNQGTEVGNTIPKFIV